MLGLEVIYTFDTKSAFQNSHHSCSRLIRLSREEKKSNFSCGDDISKPTWCIFMKFKM